MVWNKSYTNLSEAILCSFGLMVFSYFIHFEFPIKLVSFGALILTAYIFSRSLQSRSDFKKVFGGSASFKNTLYFCIVGLMIGMLLSVLYRRHLGISIFPGSLQSFVLIAALIGSLEEFVFRGLIQEHVKSLNAPFSIVFSTLSHTGYKCCLFLSPMLMAEINIEFLALWTFTAGLLFGALRHFSKSILPSLMAHAIFDIWVYAEFDSAPWWVW